MVRFSILGLVLLLGGCALLGNSAPPTTSVLVQCLPLTDDAGLAQAASFELNATKARGFPLTNIRELLGRYLSMRDADRACLNMSAKK